jgi:hypothetical protein
MKCCGREMVREGDKLVCRKCGGWVIPGAVAR